MHLPKPWLVTKAAHYARTKAGGENNLNIAAYCGPKEKHCWFPPQVRGILHAHNVIDADSTQNDIYTVGHYLV